MKKPMLSLMLALTLAAGLAVPASAAAPTVAIPMYWPVIENGAGGTVKSVPLAVSEGGTMDLLVKPAQGMALLDLQAVDADGNAVALTQVGDDRWSFVQPGSKVTVTPVFGPEDPLQAFARIDPEAPATRADLARLLWALEGQPVVNYLMRFSDVDQEAPYAEAVRWAASQKLMQGCGDGTFRPEEAITREQAAVTLYRWVQKNGGGFTGMWMFLLRHPDRAELADWAYEPVCWMTMHDILPCPDGNLHPADTIPRGTLAEMVNKCE